MRHAIANVLYGLAGFLDRRTARLDYDLEGLEFGDKRQWEDTPGETMNVQLHSRPDTKVGADYKSGRFTYSALTIGGSGGVTIFLNRRFVLRLIGVLNEMEGAYRRYGENRS